MTHEYVKNGLRQPMLFNFLLDKIRGYEIFYEPGTIDLKKSKIILKTIAFHLEGAANKEFVFKGEKVTFT